MNLCHLVFCLLLVLGASYALADPENGTSLTPSPSSSPTTWSITPRMSSESTSEPEPLLTSSEPNATSTPSVSLPPPQNHTQALVSTQQTQRSRLSQEKRDSEPFQFAGIGSDHSGASQQWISAAGGVEIVLMEPKAQLSIGEPRGAASHAMGLFLGVCGLLLCLFIGIYCAYSRGSKKELFSHHRLYEDGFDDPALFLDSPKDYDWFFYETDGYVYPTPSQSHSSNKPIQTLSVPALKQPPRALETSPEKPETPEVLQDSKQQPQPNAVKLECLSPANLNTGNFL